jgi:hypothetical protein
MEGQSHSADRKAVSKAGKAHFIKSRSDFIRSPLSASVHAID